ncbi:MAG: hypothetical protein ACRCWG_03220 [Sarcina sp.]
MSKKTKICGGIILGLFLVVGILGDKYYKANEEIIDYKSRNVYKIKNSVMHLLENEDISDKTQEFIVYEMENSLREISPEYNIEDNTQEEIDEWTRLQWSLLNTNYKKVKKENKEVFLKKYIDGEVISISPIYDEEPTYEDIGLKEFLTDISNLGK